MNLRNIDLNLLVYLNVLLEEQSVSRAAEKLALTQPTMSAALKRLRELFSDPLLVRTANGMKATAKAERLKPQIIDFIQLSEQITQQENQFDAQHDEAHFRILTNDYIESTLLYPFISSCIEHYPKLTFDVLTNGDVKPNEIEEGLVDVCINRFVRPPRSFYQRQLWRDNYCVVANKENPFYKSQTLECYLAQPHIWFNRIGYNSEPFVSNNVTANKLGWVDDALSQINKRRHIALFSRHYQAAKLLVNNTQLLATIPRRLAVHGFDHPNIALLPVPFQIIPIEVAMIWNPIKHYEAPHIWLRDALCEFAKTINDRH